MTSQEFVPIYLGVWAALHFFFLWLAAGEGDGYTNNRYHWWSLLSMFWPVMMPMICIMWLLVILPESLFRKIRGADANE